MSASIFLKVNGVTGDSTKRDGEIDVISWSWDMSQPGTAHMGKGAGAGIVTVGDVQITKNVDSTTPMLMLMCCRGDHITDAQVTVERAGGEVLEYMVLKLKNVLITNVSPSISQGDPTGMEALSLNFESYEIEVKAQNETGGGGGVATAKFNMATNKA